MCLLWFVNVYAESDNTTGTAVLASGLGTDHTTTTMTRDIIDSELFRSSAQRRITTTE